MSMPRMVLLGGAILVIVGSLMPWATVRTVFGTVNVNGTQGDGVITLAMGAVLGLVGLAYRGKPGKLYSLGAAGFAIIALIVAGSALFRVSAGSADANSEYAMASTGTGLYVAVLGSVAAAGGALGKVPGEPVTSAESASAVGDTPVTD